MTALNAKASSMFLAGIVAWFFFNQRLQCHSNKKNRFLSFSSIFVGGANVIPEPEERSESTDVNSDYNISSMDDLSLKNWERSKKAVVIGVAGGSGSGTKK